MDEPGLDRHEWESELEALEAELAESPLEGLQELDGLVTRMGEEREVVTEYVAAHEIAQAVERETEDISPGDVGAAINGFRAVFDHLVSTRSSADASITPSGEVEE